MKIVGCYTDEGAQEDFICCLDAGKVNVCSVSSREVSFSCYSKGDIKFRSRVFPHRVSLNITSLDKIGVIEDEEFFSKLCDEDAIRELNPTVDLQPTFAKYLIEWWTCNNDFLKNYITRTPKRRPEFFKAYLLKVVSGRQRKNVKHTLHRFLLMKEMVVVEKSEFNEDFCNLSIEFYDELNKEFIELLESPSCSSGLGCSDLDIDKDANEDGVGGGRNVGKEKIIKEERRLRFEKEARLMREEEKLLEDEQCLKKDYKKCNTDLEKIVFGFGVRRVSLDPTIVKIAYLDTDNGPWSVVVFRFTTLGEPIVEAQSPYNMADSLKLYQHFIQDFCHLGIEGDGGPFYMSSCNDSLIMAIGEDCKVRA
uniref:Phospholipase-like protein n=1 Tax=Tanacetum cinerariifolium TaxID=118510 RepID=A0A6L2L7J9_TANCI|nr:phospholipase-like protein [Tanacetum cinerariifolium]